MTALSHFCRLLFFLLFPFVAFSQSILLTGEVVNAKTGEPIPFVNIGALNTSKGTSSNLNGEFVLKIDTLPQDIFFSHLNYLKRAIKVNENNALTIELTPVDNVLDAIMVKGKKRDDYLVNLIVKAYDKALYSRRHQYGKAFYRQTSKTDSTYSELYEIFYDTKFSNVGITDWEVQEGRYAMVTTALSNKNFTLLSRILTTIQPDTDDFVMPINPKVEEYYEFKVSEVKKMGTREVAVVNFIPSKKVKVPAFEGDVYIDINNYDILKVKGKIQNDELNFIKITGDGIWKNYVLSYDLAYREKADSLILDYISIDQSFDYYRDEKFVYPVKTASQLTFYEYYYPQKNKRLGGNINLRTSDAAVLDKMGYNRDFWDKNEIIKRTPIELNVIEDFESKKAFGTIYLNDQKQIVLERNDVLKDSLVNELLVRFQKNSVYQEKAYLHLDKPFYTVGESIWYSAYLVDASLHQQLNGSTVLYVDLVDPDGDLVVSQNIQVKKGQGMGDILLSNDLVTGKYIIRAYTNWMRNLNQSYFFQKEVVVYNEHDQKEEPRPIEDDISIDFFPEGGDILTGVTCRIGFKAIDQDGKGIDISGKIFDSDGNQVSTFESIHLGMGSFFLNAKQGKTYHARILNDDSERIFPLPFVQGSGMALQVNNNRTNTLKIIIQASKGFNEKNYYLIGQSRGVIYSRAKGMIQNKRSIMEIPKAKLPNGIFQITLFDENGLPQCERLIFIDNQRGLDIEISPKKTFYGPRAALDFNIKILDSEGRPVNGGFSVAITDAEQLSKVPENGNIKSYLLLNSDINGIVEQPGYYFKDREKETLRNLDLLMLTQGWRRFTWKDMLSEYPAQAIHAMEKGLTISGIALDPVNAKPLADINLSVLAFTGSKAISGLVETDEKGIFEISNLQLETPATVLFNKIGAARRVSKVKVRLSNPKYLISQKGTGEYLEDLKIGQRELDYFTFDEERKTIERAFGNKSIQILEEVEIAASKEYKPSGIHGTPDAIIKANDGVVYLNIFQMIQGKVAGVNVFGTSDIRIRNSPGSPLVLLDGIPFILPSGTYGSLVSSNGQAGSEDGESRGAPSDISIGIDLEPTTGSGSELQSLLSISPNDVERIEVLKGGAAAMYGVRGANGVIAIYTKRGVSSEKKESNKQAFSVAVQGYYSAREFYSPQYGQAQPEHARPDKRATLYWNPNVKTDRNGNATISLYNSDIGSDFQIDIQGLTQSGEPINKLMAIGQKAE